MDTKPCVKFVPNQRLNDMVCSLCDTGLCFGKRAKWLINIAVKNTRPGS
jgi:hypothetical protein